MSLGEVPSRLRGFLLGIVYVNFIIFMLLLLYKDKNKDFIINTEFILIEAAISD